MTDQTATLRCCPDTSQLSLAVVCSGYIYRCRPISSASRSQQLLYTLVKQMAALPRIPAHLLPNGAKEDVEVRDAVETELLDPTTLNGLDHDAVFDQLLAVGSERRGDAQADLIDLSAEPEAMNEPVVVPEPTILPTTPTGLLARRPGLPRGLSAVNLPTRRSTAPPVSTISHSRPASIAMTKNNSYGGMTSPARSPAASRPGSVYQDSLTESTSSSHVHYLSTPRPAHNAWPLPFIYAPEDLPRLHQNLQTRLKPFFGQKLVGRQLRLSIFPVFPEGRVFERALGVKLVRTVAAGAFHEEISIGHDELSSLLGADMSAAVVEGLHLRVVAELLEETRDQPVEQEEAPATAYDDAVLSIQQDGGVRVISDIDDTIKHTEVLGGFQRMLRNAFIRDLDEMRPPGMVDWYQRMAELGVSVDYVSNSPVELFPVVRAYLDDAGFPKGSVTLKEYGGGSSMLAKLWEDAGSRKRKGVVDRLNAFPSSPFLLIGDSGEQDLLLFTSLAQEFGPERILGIFIRDVTTPFSPPTSKRQSPIGSPLASKRNSLVSSTLLDSSTDPLSPNNPLSAPPLLHPASTKSKRDAEHVSEERIAEIETFYARLQVAEKTLAPLGIPLRIFRHGAEVADEAVALIKRRTKR